MLERRPERIRMTLREEVERVLPNWERWYPSLFDAARDLGLIRARVCDPSSLLLSSRHAGITRAAEDAHREQWGGTLDNSGSSNGAGAGRRKRRKRRR
jgi:hypothetical protein